MDHKNENGLKQLSEKPNLDLFNHNIKIVLQLREDNETMLRCISSIERSLREQSNIIFFNTENINLDTENTNKNLNKTNINSLKDAMLKLCQWSKVPGIKCTDVRPACEEDFCGLCNRLESLTCVIETVLHLIFDIKRTTNVETYETILTDFLNPLTPHLIMICACNSNLYMWNNKDVVKRSSLNLDLLADAKDSMLLDEILTGSDDNLVSSTKVIDKILDEILPSLSKDSWKQNPANQVIFKFCLKHIKFPVLSELLHRVLPPVLLLVDDYEPTNKVIGLDCIQHIIGHSGKEELRWYGRADVLYDCLRHELYNKELAVIEILHPCLIGILKIVEKQPKNVESPKKWNKYDDVLVQMLSDVEIETNLTVRREMIKYATSYIEVMGITAIRHSKRFLRVTQAFLEQYDGPSERARILMLIALKTYIAETWPRIGIHYKSIFKILLKLLYDMSVDETLTPQEVKKEVMDLTVECVVILHKAAKQDISELSAIAFEELNPTFDRYIKIALNGVNSEPSV